MIKNLPVRLAQVGKIKIGKKGEERQTRDKSGTYHVPEKVDYFLITTMLRDGPNFQQDDVLMRKLDPKNAKPRQLKIVLPYDDINLNFFTEYGLYAGKKRLCYGDGENAIRIYLNSDTKVEDHRENVKCPCQYLKDGKCKPHGILSVILRENFKLGGVYQFRTTSYNSIMNILSGLTQIQQMTQGILAMIPLVMSIQPQTVTDKDNKIRTIFAVNIVADVEEWKQLLEKAKEIAQIRANAAISIKSMEERVRKMMLLKRDNNEPEDEVTEEDEAEYTPIENENSPDEQADINEEYSPDTIDDESFLAKLQDEKLANKSAKAEIPPPPDPPIDDFQISDFEKKPKYNGLQFECPPKAENKKEPEMVNVDNDNIQKQHSLF